MKHQMTSDKNATSSLCAEAEHIIMPRAGCGSHTMSTQSSTQQAATEGRDSHTPHKIAQSSSGAAEQRFARQLLHELNCQLKQPSGAPGRTAGHTDDWSVA